jgi:hypothetical protein
MSWSGSVSRWMEEVPVEREMTDTHAVLWTAIIITTVADIILTLVGVGTGLGEGNPVVRALMSAFGIPGLYIVKFLAMVWLVAGWTLLSDRNASIFLALFAIVTILVTAHNSILILAAVS